MPPSVKARRTTSSLYHRISQIIENARGNIVRAVNTQMVQAYWLIGREIVEEEQKGRKHAQYGDRLIENLSERLTNELGEGFTQQNLRNFRQFLCIRIGELKFCTQRVQNQAGRFATHCVAN